MANRIPVTARVVSGSALGCFDAAEREAKRIALATSHRKVYLQEMYFEYIRKQHDASDKWEGLVTFHFDVESDDPMDINNQVINANEDPPVESRNAYEPIKMPPDMRNG